MKPIKIMIFFLSLSLASSVKAQSNGGPTSPPFDFVASDYRFANLIRSSDPTTFKAIAYKGRHKIEIFNGITNRAYIFTVDFKDGLTTEMQVKSQFESSENARIVAKKLAIEIGRIPTILRLHLKRVIISKGNEFAFAIGNGRIFVSSGGLEYMRRHNWLEEVMMHEGVHTLFNALYGGSPLTKELRTLYNSLDAEEQDWTEATNEDPTFICTYARDNRPWEDIAESFVAYFAIRYRLNRISEKNANLIREAIPNRIAFFDNLNTEGLWCPIIAADCL